MISRLLKRQRDAGGTGSLAAGAMLCWAMMCWAMMCWAMMWCASLGAQETSKSDTTKSDTTKPETTKPGKPAGGFDPRVEPMAFDVDVMQSLAKAGCNLGACHGNANGKGGFKLSLRGDDPDFDFDVLTRQHFGRRVNVAQPEASLLLQKPALHLPHEGGARFLSSSHDYIVLREWIGQGARRLPLPHGKVVRLDVMPAERVLLAPVSQVQLQATVTFADGTQRDVTTTAVYEAADLLATISGAGLVTARGLGETTILVRYLDQQRPVRLAFLPSQPDYVWQGPPPVNFVDEKVFAKLRKLQLNPSPVCDDVTFLRRAYWDLLGILPTAEEAREFVQETGSWASRGLSSPRSPSEKRERLVERLLSRPEYADFWALKWGDVLRNEEKMLDKKGVQIFHEWLRMSISTNRPLDEFVREIIAARGSTYMYPAANYYRAMRDPITRAESAAQVFLGTRLQCARCHNHPFERWTQNDYYSWASLFARVDYRILGNTRKDRLDRSEFNGEQIVFMARSGEVNDPRTGQPRAPRFLGDVGSGPLKDDDDRLLALAEWLTRGDNELFVKTQVNRIWYHLLGRGIVEPIDDLRSTNPAVNPELLEALAADFVAHRFDVQHLIRTIMRSQVYQLSEKPTPQNREHAANFAYSPPRRLTAEQYVDGLSQVCAVPLEFQEQPRGTRAGELPGVRMVRSREVTTTLAEQMLTLLGKPQRLQSCDCERSQETTLKQALQLTSGPMLNALLTHPQNRLTKFAEAETEAAAMQHVHELYWIVLSREPTPAELELCRKVWSSAPDRRLAWEDIMWGLLNSHEFLLRR